MTAYGKLRSDARRDLLTIAFAFTGVTSPRLTQLKLSRHPLSGSMNLCDYNLLLERFEAACKDADYTNLTSSAPAPTDKKRASTGAARGGKAKKVKT